MSVCTSPQVLRARLGSRIVLLDLRSRKCFGLNATGAAIWRDLERCEPAESVVDGLCRTFVVSRSEAAASLTAFVAELKSRNLIEPSVGPELPPSGQA